jgi:hypothetical protein
LEPFGSILLTATFNGTPLAQSSTSPSNTPAHCGTGGGRIRGNWIEERRLELDATDELACERDEDQREIAGSEGVAMVLLAADHPPLRVQEQVGRLPVAVSQLEDEVMHLHRGAR